jgi:hypothetical protein
VTHLYHYNDKPIAINKMHNSSIMTCYTELYALSGLT